MTAEDILQALTRQARLVIVDMAQDATLDPKKSLKDYGASSLDMVEIVSATMRELRIKLPRAELVKVQDLDGLVRLFLTHALDGTR